MKKQSGHDCRFDQLQAFVDGTLPERLSREIGAHLGACPECRAAADKLRALDELAARAEEVASPDGYFGTFGSRVASRIAAKQAAPERSGFRWPLWGIVPLAAAAGLVLVIALRTGPPAPHLAIRLPPATRIGTAGPAAPAAPTVPEPQRPALGGSPSSAGPGLAVNSQAPAAMSVDHDQEARTAEAATAEALAGKDKSSTPTASRDEQKNETSAPDEPALAAKRASPAAERRDMRADSPSPAAPAAPGMTAVPSDAAVVLHGDKGRAPDRTGPARDQPARPPRVSLAASVAPAVPVTPAMPVVPAVPVQVIVIHLPDGSAYCPVPEIATAIEIPLPPAASSN